MNTIRKGKHAILRPHLRDSLLLAFLASAASCVPSQKAALAPQAGWAASAIDIPLEPLLLPTDIKPLSEDEALAVNAAMPEAQGPNPGAAPFQLRSASAVDRGRALDCLTSAIYYEAASESDDGQRAVAQVVLNRVRHPAYPGTVCGVVYQGAERATGCQFTFACDGSLARRPSIAGWARARRLAAEALGGQSFAPVGLSTHYHNDSVLPYWAASLAKTATIGAHIFYRWSGEASAPPAFARTYVGHEPGNLSGSAIARAAIRARTMPEATFGAATGGEARVRLANALAETSAAQGATSLPPSTIRDEYRNSGRLRERPLSEAEMAALR